MHASSSCRPLGRSLLLSMGLLACAGTKTAAPETPQAGSSAGAKPPSGGGLALPAVLPTTASTRASLKLEASFAHCRAAAAVPSGDPLAQLAAITAACAASTRMHKVAPFTGEQSAAARPQTFRFRAQAGHCYRAYGAGGAGVKNLDLLMLDGSGSALGQDGTDDATPVVLAEGAVCFKVDDDAALVVSVGDGAGPFAVELWSD